MSLLATTRMSSKGQVVIPEEIRDRLHLAPGSQFVVIGEGDAIIFKTLSAPSMRDFDGLIQRARKQAKRAGIKPSDITKAITTVRKGK
jgi:AbrB family looped-hinge helix DNA binding protein